MPLLPRPLRRGRALSRSEHCAEEQILTGVDCVYASYGTLWPHHFALRHASASHTIGAGTIREVSHLELSRTNTLAPVPSPFPLLIRDTPVSGNVPLRRLTRMERVD